MTFTNSRQAGRAIAVGIFALCLASASALGATVHYRCKRQSGGDLAALSLAVDYDAKTIDVSPDWLQPLPESLEITDTKVEWSFMRGYIELDRKTLALAWDDTAEYDYLEQIGQPATEARDTFKGQMQCAVNGS